jgi:hypothetical protein
MSERVLYAGIDEAGYGPMLGPLCTGLAVLEVPTAMWPTRGAPNVWRHLRGVVVRTAAEAKAASVLAVADSKKLKLSNGLKTKHPLTHLERGVLAFACLLRDDVLEGLTYASLRTLLGCGRDEEGFGVSPVGSVTLPSAIGADHAHLLATLLRKKCERAEVGLRALRCNAVGASRFNALHAELGNKANVAGSVVAGHVRRVWESAALRDCCDSGGVGRVVIDRQGGRRLYAGFLERALRGSARIDVLGETELRSVYELRDAGGREGSEGRVLRVSFEVDADDRHFPVALASMVAKYIRELEMARFNAWWRTICPELKPTAGYFKDARRWLDDVRSAGAADEARLATLVRRA